MTSHAVALLGLVWILVAGPAASLPVTYTKIADSTIPGPGGPLDAFRAPAVDAGVVAFRAFDIDDNDWAIYTGSGGGLTTVADRDTPLPGGGGTFRGLSDPSISAGNLAFYSGIDKAVYSTLGGTLGVVADASTPDPDGGGAIEPLWFPPSIDGANVAFTAHSANGAFQFYTQIAGALETSVSEGMSIPGGGGLLGMYAPPQLSGTQIAFRGVTATNDLGVYVADAGIVRVVANRNTPIPGSSGTFLIFGSVFSFDAGNVVFTGYEFGIEHIYAEIGGMLVRVSDTQFQHLTMSASISGETIAYTGSGGLYFYRGGSSELVIASGDTLDGKTIVELRFGSEGLSGDQFAFAATFSDGTEGVYLATIPEPGTGMLLALGLAALGARPSRLRPVR